MPEADEAAVYRRIEEIKANTSTVFKSKKLFMDAVEQLDLLASGLDESDPYNQALIAYISFCQAGYYGSAEESLQQIQHLIKAGRLYALAAVFQFGVARLIKDAWTEPISDAIHCYRNAVRMLRDAGKLNLAVVLMRELAEKEAEVELWELAGRTLEEAVNFAVERCLRSSVAFDAGFQGIGYCAKVEEVERALRITERLQAIGDERRAGELSALRATLRLWKQDWPGFEEASAGLTEELKQALGRLVPGVKAGLAGATGRVLYEIRSVPGLAPLHLELLERMVWGMRRQVSDLLPGGQG